MEDQLISFETAKLAKEKGFNLWTSCKAHFPLYLKGEIEYRDFIRNIGEPLAPTQSLLQRWLREEFDYHASVRRAGKDWKTSIDEYTTFETYEEALERGLQELLKLIK